MSIHSDIKSEIKEALKNKEQVRLSVLRGLSTAFTNEAISNGKTPQDELNDEEVMKVIKREANKRKDSIEQYEKGGRSELAEQEKEELEILEKYLPEMMSHDEIRKIAETKKAELGIDDKSKMGILIGAIIKEAKGQADGKDVKDIVDSIL